EPPAAGTVTTDPARFRQVLLNLLSNAIKFTPRSGRGTVTCEGVGRVDPGGGAAGGAGAPAGRLAGRGTGSGSAPEGQAKVWEEFRQLRSSALQTQEGTGLGLALTRRLVRLLGGLIWLQSAAGQGSTFTLVLPRQAPAGPPPDTGEAARDRPLVLVIEDYP